jgi:hypothetical protein
MHLRSVELVDRGITEAACQPLLCAKGVVNPSGWPASMAEEPIGILVMVCTPPASITSWVPLITACAAKCTACCEEPHWRSIVVPGTLERLACGKPGGAGDVAGEGADGVDAAEDDVIVIFIGDGIAFDNRLDYMGAEIGAVHRGKTALALAGGRTQGIDDIGFGHGRTLNREKLRRAPGAWRR